jgi:hypothetical protein
MGTEETVRYYQQVSSHGSRALLSRLGLSWAGRLRELAILRGSGVSLTRTGDVVRLRLHPNWYTVLIRWLATALNVVLFLLRLAQALLSLVVICLARLLDVLGRLAERLATATVPRCSQEVHALHRRFIIKKTWPSAFSYAQSRIMLVICRSLTFRVPWFSSFIDKTDLADFVCYVWRRRWEGGGGLCLFVCKNYISLSLIYLNIFFAMYTFEKI